MPSNNRLSLQGHGLPAPVRICFHRVPTESISAVRRTPVIFTISSSCDWSMHRPGTESDCMLSVFSRFGAAFPGQQPPARRLPHFRCRPRLPHDTALAPFRPRLGIACCPPLPDPRAVLGLAGGRKVTQLDATRILPSAASDQFGSARSFPSRWLESLSFRPIRELYSSHLESVIFSPPASIQFPDVRHSRRWTLFR